MVQTLNSFSVLESNGQMVCKNTLIKIFHHCSRKFSNNNDSILKLKILGITIDYIAERIYWVDARQDYIGSSDFDGNGFKKVIQNDERVSHPFAVAVFKDRMYWDDWKQLMIFIADKDHGLGISSITGQFAGLMDLKVTFFFFFSYFRSNCRSFDRKFCHQYEKSRFSLERILTSDIQKILGSLETFGRYATREKKKNFSLNFLCNVKLKFIKYTTFLCRYSLTVYNLEQTSAKITQFARTYALEHHTIVMYACVRMV